ncbi:hypothetical protein GCM10009721_34240 [Terrabacter tumescens]|uniref:DUF5941 domain-containing protein n=1 Tax=Terrabacter tumescens TaxID=60443 RepID=A0ABQ2IC89_9MICO|nr:hypothetical protein GCM10009721_34240 [Terrabacter tumescens]
MVVLGGVAGKDLLESLEPFALVVVHGAPSQATVSAQLVAAADVAAGSTDRPLVLVSHDLRISPVGLLDILDSPHDATSAAVVDGPFSRARHATSSGPAGGFTPVRVDDMSRRLVSTGSAHHVVSGPTTYAAGLLRVAAADRPRVARALRAAAASESARLSGMQTIDLALLAVVRDAVVPVVAVPLTHLTVARGTAQRPGAPGSAWQQRLRAASRGNDGVFSTHAIRPLSRRLTAYGLMHGWSPNVVTGVSLLLGLAACALVTVDTRWTWVAAALVLQMSLVVDCVDGEIARFTRRKSAVGGWLDAVSDRVKEFTMLAAVAWVSLRRGNDVWWLAIIVLALLAIRHAEDFAYTTRRRASAMDAPRQVPLDEPLDGGPPAASTVVPGPSSRRTRLVRDVKQVLHFPIAERYLVMSLALVAFSPELLLWALALASALALAWTQAGRLARALSGRDGFHAGRPDATLEHLVDLSVLPRPSGRRRLSWQVPGILIGLEAASLLLAAGSDPAAGAAAYAWLAAVCWHVYDNVYRLRETGHGTPRPVVRATLGVEGRIVVLALVGGFSDAPALPLLVGAVLVLAVHATDSLRAWRGGSAVDQTQAGPGAGARSDGREDGSP